MGNNSDDPRSTPCGSVQAWSNGLRLGEEESSKVRGPLAGGMCDKRRRGKLEVVFTSGGSSKRLCKRVVGEVQSESGTGKGAM
jgi:hypothetical protein